MATGSYEVIEGVLWVSGNLDRSTDNDFQQALEQYSKNTPPDSRVIEMSNVRWLAPSSAKVLIASAQEAQEKNGKMRVLASRHAMQTLNLLGAKTWLTIENALTPNARPGEAAPPAGDPPSKAELLTPPPTPVPSSPSKTETQKLPVQAGILTPPPTPPVPTIVPPAAPATASRPLVAPADAPIPASASGLMGSVKVAGALAGPAEELSRGACLLRALCPSRRYAFHFQGTEQIIGVVRERVGGSWILVDTHGTRKLINLDWVLYCEML